MDDVRYAGGHAFKPRGIEQQAIHHGSRKTLCSGFLNVFRVGGQYGLGVLANGFCKRGQSVVALFAAGGAQNPRGGLGVFA